MAEESDDASHLQEQRALVAPRLYDQLFDTVLPGQYREGDWRIRVSPKFGRVFSDDYMRLLVGLRYNFSNYFDVTNDFGAYFPNPFQDGSGSDLYLWHIGIRYTWFNVSDSKINLAAGLNTDLQLSDAPLEVSDGYARYMPYVTLSRQLEHHPNWLLYSNLTYEIIQDSPFSVTPHPPMPKDRLFLRFGGIYYPGGKFRYSVELEYRTNILDYNGEQPVPPSIADSPPPDVDEENWFLAYNEVHEIYAYPAVTWFPKWESKDGFRIPGRWDIAIRVRIPIVQEGGKDFGVSLRVRWHLDSHKFRWMGTPRRTVP